MKIKIDDIIRKEVEALNLKTLAGGGFPKAETCEVRISWEPGRRAASWQWRGRDKKHVITFYPDGLKACVPEPVLSNRSALRRVLYMLYQHERGHALFTERDPEITRAALKSANIPFVIANALEDCRIERKISVIARVKFRWDGAFPAIADVAPDCWANPNAWDVFSFILACKNALNKVPTTVTRSTKLRDAMRRTLFSPVEGGNPHPWVPASDSGFPLEFSPYASRGHKGTLRAATRIVAEYVTDPRGFADRIVAFAKKWRDAGLPLPPADDSAPEGLPSLPGGKTESEASGDLGADNETSAPGADDNPSEKDLREIQDATGAKEDDPSKKPGRKDTGADSKRYDERDGIGPMQSASPGEPLSVSCGLDTAFGSNYDPHVVLECEGWDLDGEICSRALSVAFPGVAAHYSADPGGMVDLDRYMDRRPEMFKKNRRGYGKRGDVILIIDGSGSMNQAWRSYGMGITAGLIRLRRAGALRRLRVILTYGKHLRDFGDVTDLELPMHISCHASTEGLWAAYEHIARSGMIDSPDVQTIVITDGDIVDTHPSLQLAHAAGCYPVGVFLGQHHASDKVKAFFDQFIVRRDREALIDEVARLF